MIRLYTTFYPEKNKTRMREYEKTLRKNISISTIEEIIIFNEGADLPEFKHPKCKIIAIGNRPEFHDFFAHINQHTKKEDINIIANTDIAVDKNIAILKCIDLKNKFFALSRWETTNGLSLFNRNDSQDTWISKGKIKPVKSNIPIGIPRCDNRLLYELEQAGYEVLNPAFSIKTYHIHAGKKVEYAKINDESFVLPPYKYLYPHNLFGFWRTYWFNLLHKPYSLTKYRYDIKKTNNWLVIRIIRKLYKFIFNKKFPQIGYNTQCRL